MTINCDTIAWFVDMIGTDELLKSVADCENVVVMGRGGKERENFRKKVDGLYFDGAHWYSVKDGVEADSYSKGYQVRGTDHFCQTFALMIFTGNDDVLKAGEYDQNIKRAMLFWKSVFNGHRDLLKWIAKQANKTPEEFMTFITQVEANSGKLVGCRHG